MHNKNTISSWFYINSEVFISELLEKVIYLCYRNVDVFRWFNTMVCITAKRDNLNEYHGNIYSRFIRSLWVSIPEFLEILKKYFFATMCLEIFEVDWNLQWEFNWVTSREKVHSYNPISVFHPWEMHGFVTIFSQ